MGGLTFPTRHCWMTASSNARVFDIKYKGSWLQFKVQVDTHASRGKIIFNKTKKKATQVKLELALGKRGCRTNLNLGKSKGTTIRHLTHIWKKSHEQQNMAQKKRKKGERCRADRVSICCMVFDESKSGLAPAHGMDWATG